MDHYNNNYKLKTLSFTISTNKDDPKQKTHLWIAPNAPRQPKSKNLELLPSQEDCQIENITRNNQSMDFK